MKEENDESVPQKIVRDIVRDLSEKSITANVISCGITEEYLLARFEGKMNIKDAFESVSGEFNNARMIDPSEVAAAITFFSQSHQHWCQWSYAACERRTNLKEPRLFFRGWQSTSFSFAKPPVAVSSNPIVNGIS